MTEENKRDEPQEKKEEHHVEHHEKHSLSSVSKTKKVVSWKKILTALIILAIVFVALMFIFDWFGVRSSKTVEKWEMSYSVYDGENLIDSGEKTITKGTLANSLGFKTNKLDSSISGMKEGETKEITLSTNDAFGEYDSTNKQAVERIQTVNRTIEIERLEQWQTSEFTQVFSEQPIQGKTYLTTEIPWGYYVVSIENDVITLRKEISLGMMIPWQTFNYEATAVTDTTVSFKLQGQDTVLPGQDFDVQVKFLPTEVQFILIPVIGNLVEIPDVATGIITEFNDTHFIVDSNNFYAGKEIKVSVTLNSITIDKKSTGKIPNAPTLQFYIMSHCPYGTQMAKAVLPVWKELEGKANIELRFVSYTMHGAKEELDNNRLICIREEQSDKLLDYLNCFVYGDGSESSSQACIQSTKIDAAKLNTCLSSNVDSYMDEDKALNTEYGVQGSPTVILNGEDVSLSRSPSAVAEAICNAFTTNKPSECSQSFSTTQASAGFGAGAASSSNGSC